MVQPVIEANRSKGFFVLFVRNLGHFKLIRPLQIKTHLVFWFGLLVEGGGDVEMARCQALALCIACQQVAYCLFALFILDLQLKLLL